MSIKIFVYGTLLKGMTRAMVLEKSLCLGPAITQANLYNIGTYPGIKQGNGITIGEIYNITEDVLDRLDRIEGYFPSDLSSSLFTRKKIVVRNFANGDRTEALTYIYNHQPNEHMTILHGDYRRYLLEQENDSQWIISYGSNMSSNRLEKRVGQVDSYQKGFLKNFKLIFNKQANQKNTVFANVIYSGQEDHCPVIAARLTTTQIEELDLCEGVPNHYLRIGIPFYTDSGEEILGQMYIAHPDRLTDSNYPESGYLEHIRAGYKEYELDESYLDSILYITHE